jgi:hypothetical protein
MIVRHVRTSEKLSIFAKRNVFNAFGHWSINLMDFFHGFAIPNAKSRLWSDFARCYELSRRVDSQTMDIITVA